MKEPAKNPKNNSIKNRLRERFFRYVAVESQSKAGAPTVPSTEGQRALAMLLKDELEQLGLVDVFISEYSVLTARVPARPTISCGISGRVPAVGFVAHLDTVDVNLSPEVHPQLVAPYTGGDLCLNQEKNIFIRLSEHPELARYAGQDIICTDGTSVLGADNKAAIAAITTALEQLRADADAAHGEIYVAFVPDEEIGLLGVKHLEMARFPVDFAYTIDCCELGEVVYETFNAASATVRIEGVSAHPMSAKGVLVNPALVAADFINLFDRAQTPENTEGTEGYIWAHEVHANQSEALVRLSIRDHDKQKFDQKKTQVREAVRAIASRYARAKINCEIDDVYGNIADAITDENRRCTDILFEAMERLEITPRVIPMRGGTDGAYLSSQGILTPNFFTGAHNFHSYCEFLPMDSFEKSCQMVGAIIDLVYRRAALQGQEQGQEQGQAP